MSLSFAMAFSSRASHSAGGEIFYEYIGDSTGIPFQYKIKLVLYFDQSGVTAPSSVNVCYNSSCFSGGTLNINNSNFSVQPIPNRFQCLLSTSPGYVDIGLGFYEDVITLQGKCADWTFSYSLCCRNSAVGNLQNAASNQMIIQAKLNNTIGPNSSPVFLAPPQVNSCIGTEVKIAQATLEPDGDSLFYQNATPQAATGFCPNLNVMDIPYDQGYSAAAPVTSSTGVQFNSRNGTLTFTPSISEVDALRTSVSEYRFDTVAQVWLKVGEINRDFQIAIGQTCKTSVVNMQIQHPSDSTLPYEQLFCGDSTLFVKTSSIFDCQTLTPTDFALHDQNGHLLPIVATSLPQGCQAGFAEFIGLHLNRTIYYDDTLTLVSRVGNDGNTLRNVCGFSLKEFDTLQFYVQDCQTGFSLAEEENRALEIFPNPAREKLTVRFENAAARRLTLWDARGKILQQWEIRDTEVEIPLKNLSRGIYILKSENGETRKTARFSKS